MASAEKWGRLTSSRESGGALLLDDASLAACSAELQELCRRQLDLLSVTLQLSLRAVLNSSFDGSLDEELLRQQLLKDASGLRSTVYVRSPASLQTGQLTMQLVAAVGGDPGADLQQQQRQQQRFLFLGQDGMAGCSMLEQEQQILEQQIIVLPDSGGLVLPLASNGFLVGLLVVERYLETEQQQLAQGPPSAGAAAAAPASRGVTAVPGTAGIAGAAGHTFDTASSVGSAMVTPPTGLLFRSAELQLLKQSAAVLSMACAMDLRAALERVGAASRQGQASALVQAGTRLQEVVQQLQVALHPAVAASVVPPALLQSSGNTRQRKALPPSGGSSPALDSLDGSSSGQWQLAVPMVDQPGPLSSSSSSDCDFQQGSTIEMSVDEPSSTARPSASQSPSRTGDGSSSSSNGSGSSRNSITSSSSDALVFGSRASANLLNVLMPLLASATNFAAVSGVRFVVASPGGGTSAASASGPGAASATATATGTAQRQLVLPAAEVAVGPGKLKRMLSQLVDGVMACALRGDLVQASVLAQEWQGRPGVAISLCCCYSLAHDGGSAARDNGSVSSRAATRLHRPPLQPEFAFLEGSALEAGGFFEVNQDRAPDVQHLNSSTLSALLWLPAVGHEAAWG
ncbi:hypothetical protein ACK3TF_001471 [Chlorella vulgaris]